MGKAPFTKKGYTKPIFDWYGIYFAPMNISKSFRPNLNSIRVLSLGTKFIPKWDKPKTSETFKKFINSRTK